MDDYNLALGWKKSSAWFLSFFLIFFLGLVFFLFSFQFHRLDKVLINFDFIKSFSIKEGLFSFLNFEQLKEIPSFFSSFLLGVIYYFFKISLILSSKLIGLFVLSSIGILFWLFGFRNPWSGICFLILLLNPYLIYWSQSGLDISFEILFLVLGFFGLKRSINSLFYFGILGLCLLNFQGSIYALVLCLFHENRKKLSLLILVKILFHLIVNFFIFNSFLPISIEINKQSVLLNLKNWTLFFNEIFFNYLVGILLILYALLKKQYSLVSLIITQFLLFLVLRENLKISWEFLISFYPFFAYILVMMLWDLIARFRELVAVGMIFLLNISIFLGLRWWGIFETMVLK